MLDPQLALLISYIAVLAVFAILIFSGSSLVFAFQRFCTWRAIVASRKRHRSLARHEAFKKFVSKIGNYVKSKLEKPEVAAPDFSLWEENPHHIEAIRHRTLKLGRKEHTKLIVSDYPNGKSIATLRTKTDRIRLCDAVVTGPSGDATLLEAAEEKLAA